MGASEDVINVYIRTCLYIVFVVNKNDQRNMFKIISSNAQKRLKVPKINLLDWVISWYFFTLNVKEAVNEQLFNWGFYFYF